MSSFKKHPLITGTIILTLTGMVTRVMGFFYRIFLSHTIGAEGLGIYQLIFPVYALCFALSTSGIQTGISRCAAASFAQKNPGRARVYFSSGFFLSLFLSVGVSLFLHRYADTISSLILEEPRCAPLLRLISWSIPLGAIHSCISAWYFAQKKTKIPSFSQLAEQLARISASFVIYLIFTEKGIKPTPLLAAAGLLAGELVSSLFSSLCILFDFQSSPSKKEKTPSISFRLGCTGKLLTLSLPLTANRVLLTLLQSAEAVLIPASLKAYGLSSSQALSIYGILTGMALPFILFPSAITNSLSTMLLPVIAGEQAQGNREKIISSTEKTIKYCLLLGIFAGGVFFFFGDTLGVTVYKNEDAGTFMRILSFLCPFLYLTGTMSSILNGLGHTFLCFLQNAVGLSIRILFVIFAVPQVGIQGYLWGLLISQLIIAFLNYTFVHRKVAFTFYPAAWILFPVILLLISCGLGLAAFSLCCPYFPPLICLMISLGICGISYILFLVQTKQIHISS